MDARQAHVLRRALERDRVDLHTGMPGRVRSFSVERQTIEVELGLRCVIPSGDEDEADTLEDYPILPEVPVCFPAGGGFRISWPLEAGDYVWVMFGEGDLSRWRETGEPSDPGVATRHGLSGAVAYPGIHPRGGANGSATGDSLRIEREGGPVLEITGSEVRAGGTAELGLAADIKAHLQAIDTALTTIGTAAGASSSYVYATVLAASPIATTTTKGA